MIWLPCQSTAFCPESNLLLCMICLLLANVHNGLPCQDPSKVTKCNGTNKEEGAVSNSNGSVTKCSAREWCFDVYGPNRFRVRGLRVAKDMPKSRLAQIG